MPGAEACAGASWGREPGSYWSWAHVQTWTLAAGRVWEHGEGVVRRRGLEVQEWRMQKSRMKAEERSERWRQLL